ncbi:MAG: cytochrome ubiquinol oxidase subunit I [Spongiibacteraceae bacterium]|jgi:cytochrome d ubiquinol oxidase subunit I|nr:cytochrome ubiquinol oxidase subunit I [Spongiibacteraceae bacterium]
MILDPLILARIQFAANISFHILFPAISIGLAWLLLFFRWRYTRTGDKTWEYAYFFWVKIFALTFAMGVVSGITMSFQFGTNWPGFMERAGNVAGPLLGYEVLTAFFLEASFLGIMLFGKDRVSNRMHLISTFLVAFGTALSAFWILSLNSWMQTPTGYRLEEGVVMVESWWAVIFNPSFPYRFLHMLAASILTSAFLVAGVSAWRALRGMDGPGTWKVMRVGVIVAAIMAPLQIFLGDLHGLNTLEHQPAKVAAMEALWDTEEGAPFVMVAWPDEKSRSNRFALEVPYAASLILTHDAKGKVQGLNDFVGEHPPVALVFWSFRVMLLVGVLMLVVGWWAAWELRGNRRAGRPLLHALSWMTFSGWVAVLAGWYVTEIGRQPWIVEGVLLVKDVVADHSSATLTGTLLGYVFLYLFLLAFYVAAIRHLSLKPAASLALGPVSFGPKLSARGEEV